MDSGAVDSPRPTTTLLIYTDQDGIEEVRGRFPYESAEAFEFEGYISDLWRAFKDCPFSIRHVCE